MLCYAILQHAYLTYPFIHFVLRTSRLSISIYPPICKLYTISQRISARMGWDGMNCGTIFPAPLSLFIKVGLYYIIL